ncbi:MAG: hypothetical protein JRE63_12845 [Deltaproteobacteria bacterium]|nr:hypothetical protein [Deltaproteobacteria bacterium]MBW2518827.1 hypothetical protein [Deltaproteobacteria bacterium]
MAPTDGESLQRSPGLGSAGWPFFCWGSWSIRIPVNVAVKTAATGLAIVMNGSSNAHVIAIQSTPDSGVDTINAADDPRLAYL